MTNGIYLTRKDWNNRPRIIVWGKGGLYPTPYLPDVVELVARVIFDGGYLHGGSNIGHSAYKAIHDAAKVISAPRRNRRARRIYVGKRKTSLGYGFKIGRNCYEKDLIPAEQFSDKDIFEGRVREIVIAEGVKIVLNTGIDVDDIPLSESEYKDLLTSIEKKEPKPLAS